MNKILLITIMAIIALANVIFMKKIAPEDKIYPVWALFVVTLFALVIWFH